MTQWRVVCALLLTAAAVSEFRMARRRAYARGILTGMLIGGGCEA